MNSKQFIINSERALPARQHRRKVFKAQVRAKIKPALPCTIVLGVVLAGFVLAGAIK